MGKVGSPHRTAELSLTRVVQDGGTRTDLSVTAVDMSDDFIVFGTSQGEALRIACAVRRTVTHFARPGTLEMCNPAERQVIDEFRYDVLLSLVSCTAGSRGGLQTRRRHCSRLLEPARHANHLHRRPEPVGHTRATRVLAAAGFRVICEQQRLPLLAR